MPVYASGNPCDYQSGYMRTPNNYVKNSITFLDVWKDHEDLD